MSTQHTPGPWIQNPGPDYGSEENKRCNRLYIRLGAGSAYAVIEKKNVFEKVSDEDLANARLVAAAPELLTKLQKLVERFDEEIRRLTDHGFRGSDFIEYREAQQATAKATHP